ncbi:hypothetical protein ACRAWF_26745, partial [Streptomyces sp. L7]
MLFDSRRKLGWPAATSTRREGSRTPGAEAPQLKAAIDAVHRAAESVRDASARLIDQRAAWIPSVNQHRIADLRSSSNTSTTPASTRTTPTPHLVASFDGRAPDPDRGTNATLKDLQQPPGPARDGPA